MLILYLQKKKNLSGPVYGKPGEGEKIRVTISITGLDLFDPTRQDHTHMFLKPQQPDKLINSVDAMNRNGFALVVCV